MFDRIKAKEKSKTLLRTRSIQDFLGFAVVLFAQFMLPFIVVISILGANIPSVIMSVVSSNWAYMLSGVIPTVIIALVIGVVVGGIILLFHAGMNRAALRMNRGDKNVRVLDIILAGDRLSRYIAITLWQLLFIFLWNLPSAALVIIAIVVIITGLGSSVSSAFAVILIIAAWIWSAYISVNKMCQYYFAYCVAEDNRDMAALECIRESSSLMVDHKWELFVTKLSFLGWDIIASLPFGNVFVNPYKYLTYTSIYEQLNGNFRPMNTSHMLWLQNGSGKHVDDNDKVEHVVEIISGEFAGATIPVKSGEDITIGRDPKRANVVTSSENTSISGLHCRIRYDEQSGRYIVIDHSTNGTYLNNEKLVHERGTYAAKGSIIKLADGAMILRLS